MEDYASDAETEYYSDLEEYDSDIDDSDQQSDCSSLLSENSFLGSDIESDIGSVDAPILKDTAFRRFLVSWAVVNCVPRTHVNALLKGIKEHIELPYNVDLALPYDYRSLLHTPRNISNVIRPAGAFGSFAYLGIKKGIERLVKQGLDLSSKSSEIKILTFVDGFTAHNNRKKKFWTVLHSVEGDIYQRVFMSGLYSGVANPDPFNEILKPFVDEFNALKMMPFSVEGVNHKLKLISGGAVVTDNPAKADAKCTKPSGYCSCQYCCQKGKACPSTVIFDELTYDKRTDQSFRDRDQPEHHKGCSALENIEDLDMIKDFPPDYMHLILLGIMKRLLLIFWKWNSAARLSKEKRLFASEIFERISEEMPCEFQWRPRDLNKFERFKAKEYRYFLLYAGLVVFKEVLEEKDYQNFVGLSMAIRILSCPEHELNEEWLCRAEALIYNFIHYVKNSLGERHLVPVFHGALHIVDSCRRFGNLNKFSAFPFESYISHIKRMLKSPHLPLAQVVRRYVETEFGDIFRTPPNLKTQEGLLGKRHDAGPILNSRCIQFESVVLKEFLVKRTPPNNTVLLSTGAVIMIDNIIKKKDGIYFLGRRFSLVQDYFLDPVPSSLLNIIAAKQLLPQLEEYSSNLLLKKCFNVTINDTHVIIPLIH